MKNMSESYSRSLEMSPRVSREEASQMLFCLMLLLSSVIFVFVRQDALENSILK